MNNAQDSLTEQLAREMYRLLEGETPHDWIYSPNEPEIEVLWRRANATCPDHSDGPWTLVKERVEQMQRTPY